MRFLSFGAQKSAKAPRRARRWSRRRLLAAGAVAVLIAMSGGGWWLVRSGVAADAMAVTQARFFAVSAAAGFAVADVQVEGRQRASREAILTALGVRQGMPILAIDPALAKRRLESLSWVRSASIERRLPDTLYIRIVERQPLALWQRQGKLVLVDRDGVEVPTEPGTGVDKLVVLVGADAPKQGTALLDMLATEPELAPHVTAAVRIGGRRWNLRLDNNIDVALPEENPLGAWHRLAELEHSDAILERDIEMVDLRLPDRLVVRTPHTDAPKPPPKKNRIPGKAT